jgi:polyphenol oxidase
MRWREVDGVRWLEADVAGARAAFTTRLGGTSGGSFESLNVGLLTEDEEARVRENRLRLAAALGRDAEGILFGHQVHGTEVLRRETAPDPNPYAHRATPPPADAQVTAAEPLTPMVQVADCLPVALAGERGVAAVHCGWRGLAGGIVEDAVHEVGATAAALGPGIGPCCYRVGPEVLAQFEPLGEGVARGRNLDLNEVVRRQLERAGVRGVETAGLCTSCERELFFSHRRDRGRTGRQAGLIWLDGDG